MRARSLKLSAFRMLGVGLGSGLCLAAGLFAPKVHAQVYVIDSPDATRCYRAAAMFERNDAAIGSCTGAIRADALTPRDYGGTYVNRGLLELRAGRNEAAMDDFNKGVGLVPLLGEAWIDQAAGRLAVGDDQGAITDSTKGLALGSSHREMAYWIRAYARERSHDWNGAYADYRRAAALAPSWREPQLDMARFEVRAR